MAESDCSARSGNRASKDNSSASMHPPKKMTLVACIPALVLPLTKELVSVLVSAVIRCAPIHMTNRADASLRELAYKIVTLAVYYDTVQSFLEDYSHLTFGLTSHALCSGIREFTKVCIHLQKLCGRLAC